MQYGNPNIFRFFAKNPALTSWLGCSTPSASRGNYSKSKSRSEVSLDFLRDFPSKRIQTSISG